MADMGNLLGLMIWYSCEDTVFSVFGDKLIQVKPKRDVGMLENFHVVDSVGETVGPATEQGVFTMLERMISDKIFSDRLIVCSDLQIGDGRNHEYGLGSLGPYRHETPIPELLKRYRNEVNPNLIYYSVCFNGYGNDVVIGDKKVLISGFSDKILHFIADYEKDRQTQVKHIKETY